MKGLGAWRPSPFNWIDNDTFDIANHTEVTAPQQFPAPYPLAR